MSKLTHFDTDGKAAMVDVSDKDITERSATAAGSVHVTPETMALIAAGDMKKGDVLGVARLAGIMAAKRTPDLIPLCHPLALTAVAVDLECNAEASTVDITATCKLKGRTGVEMEALTAVSVAALTVYDMCKAIDKAMTIGEVRLVHKAGGRSSNYNRDD
ncbi:MAG: cyclic pyranopterin monophosphate synthase MoaC [Pseudomonadota bacterium]|nr:cyclic pyranopterin monophosphate synthase MoaC [Pseudomonadota bacterium]